MYSCTKGLCVHPEPITGYSLCCLTTGKLFERHHAQCYWGKAFPKLNQGTNTKFHGSTPSLSCICGLSPQRASFFLFHQEEISLHWGEPSSTKQRKGSLLKRFQMKAICFHWAKLSAQDSDCFLIVLIIFRQCTPLSLIQSWIKFGSWAFLWPQGCLPRHTLLAFNLWKTFNDPLPESILQ